MNKLLRNEQWQQQLEANGYVLLDFIGTETVEELLRFYRDYPRDENGQGFEVGLDNPDKAAVRQTTDYLATTLRPAADRIFRNPKIFTASYVVKHPGKEHIVPPHQDWTFTDERSFTSVTVWIPLVDTTVENGALCMIRGSHKFFDHPRSSPSPQSKSAIADHVFTLFPYSEPIEMKAGQALIFDNRTIHSSLPNRSTEPRTAVGIGVVNREAPLWHYYQSPGDPHTLNLYEVKEDFFNAFDNKTLSDRYEAGELLTEQKSLGTIERRVPLLSGVEIESMVRNAGGNRWHQEVAAAVSALHELYQKPTHTMNKEHKKAAPPEGGNETASQASQETAEWKDDRTFFEKYTIPNIIAEIKWRLTGKS